MKDVVREWFMVLPKDMDEVLLEKDGRKEHRKQREHFCLIFKTTKAKSFVPLVSKRLNPKRLLWPKLRRVSVLGYLSNYQEIRDHQYLVRQHSYL